MKIVGLCIFIEVNICVLLRILNFMFKDNEVDFGGFFFVDSFDGFLYVNIINVSFVICKVKKYGCVIIIGKFLWSGYYN